MAGSLGALVLELSANTVKWEADLGRAARTANKTADEIGKTFTKVATSIEGLFAGGAITLAIMKSVEAAREAEQAQTRLEAVIRATGSSSGVTKFEIDELADSMAELTQFDDESIREAAAVLLKFGNVQGDTFKEGLRLAADWAAFTKQEIPEAAQTIGKALASPKEGLTALERQMGKLTESQKEEIASLVELGRTAEAQGKVLDILRSKVGGAAEELNSGYTKALRDATKAQNEFWEAIGKTSVVQDTTQSFFKFLKDSFGDLKRIVEDGDWVEKALALAAFAGGWRGMPLSKAATQETPGAREKADAGAAAKRQQELEEAVLREAAETEKWYGPLREKWKREAEAAAKENTRNSEAAARAELEAEEITIKETAEAWEIVNKQILADEKARVEGSKEMWRQVFETIDREQEEAIEQGKQLLESLSQEEKKNEEAARQLGLTFSSAFEDAVVNGKKLQDVLKGIAMDVARIFLRKTLTEPLAGGLTDLIKGGLGGLSLGKLFGGSTPAAQTSSSADFLGALDLQGFADGGSFQVGGHGGTDSQLVAFRATPGENVSVGKGGNQGMTVYIDATGADPAALARVEAQIRALDGSIEYRSIAATAGARGRGGGYRHAMRG